jgi:hypothetical protein
VNASIPTERQHVGGAVEHVPRIVRPALVRDDRSGGDDHLLGSLESRVSASELTDAPKRQHDGGDADVGLNLDVHGGSMASGGGAVAASLAYRLRKWRLTAGASWGRTVCAAMGPAKNAVSGRGQLGAVIAQMPMDWYR